MSLYLVAVPENNMKSPIDLYDYNDLIGDVFETKENANLLDYFRGKFSDYAGDTSFLSESSIVLMTNDDVFNLEDRYPGDEDVRDLIVAYHKANEDYPSSAFYFTFF